MKKIARRIKEPSTHAGIAGVLLSLAQLLPHYALPLNAAASLFGGLAIALKERGGAE